MHLEPYMYWEVTGNHIQRVGGTLFLNISAIYYFWTGLPISMYKDIYINIAMSGKTVNLLVPCKYLKKALNLKKLYTFISRFSNFHCF